MENEYDIADFIKLTDNRSVENVTPHKVAVVAFIREFGTLKQEAKEIAMFQCTMAPKYRKDFCMLALKLTQCPDMEFKELEALLTNRKYNLLSAHLQLFCTRLQEIYENGCGALYDCVNSTVEKLIIEPTETSPCLISRNSVLGFYLRKMALYVGKLTYEQLTLVYKDFCSYYQKGRPGSLVRSMSREKLNVPEYGSTPSSSPGTRSEDKYETLKPPVHDKDGILEVSRWSRKQAELFVAQQASYLQNDEAKAMPPPQLQKILSQIIRDIPDYADVHFVSFLNQLRGREVCGAQDSLYEYFDRAVCSSAAPTPSDRNKTIRYAAINQAAMYKSFGFDELAASATEEALLMAQEAGDTCGVTQIVPDETQVLPSQSNTPAYIFTQLLIRGETVSYQTWSESLSSSIGQAAALWSLLGNTEMCSIYAQLALNLYTKGNKWCGNNEASLCALASALAARAHNSSLRALVGHSPDYINLRRLHYHHDATAALYSGKWLEAEQSIHQLSSIDRWESQVLKAELYYLKGEPTSAMEAVNDILDNCQSEKESMHYVSLRVRAMLIRSQLDPTFTSSAMMVLNDALMLARKNYLHYLAAVTEMHIANGQLLLGCSKLAYRTVKRAMPVIMANGSAFDMARARVLFARCKVASSKETDRDEIIKSSCQTLDNAVNHFKSVSAHSRLRDTLYLQAMLYHEIGMTSARNQSAFLFRQVDAQHSTSNLAIMSF